MSHYSQHVAGSGRAYTTPQSKPLPGRDQVQNAAGGYVFQTSCFERLTRFLILGSESNTYYATARQLTVQNSGCILECAREDVIKTVDIIAEISRAGRAPKNDPAIYALAVVASAKDLPGRNYAFTALNTVCRTGTHLFQFINIVDKLRGWGRALRTAVSEWYLSRDADSLAYQVTKYQQREGWSHRDALRMAHPNPRNAGHKDVFQYIAQKQKWLESRRAGTRMLVMAEEAKTASIQRLCRMIREEGLVREHIPTERLNNKDIWVALLENMPMTAMIRNLATMTAKEVIAPLSRATALVCEKLQNQEYLEKARIHPFNVLVAMETYRRGRGLRGSQTWTPVPQVVKALEDAFYASFKTLPPTNKRYLYALDISGSMGWENINGLPITPAMAGACLALVAAKTEPQTHVVGFSTDVKSLGFTANDSLSSAMGKADRMTMGGTDASAAIRYADRASYEVDAFVIITDSETWAGPEHASEALEHYRQKSGINAKLIAIGMTATECTICDPNDVGSLNMVGFDSAGPSIISEFVGGDKGGF